MTRKLTRWKEEETKYLIDNFGKIPLIDICNKLNKNRKVVNHRLNYLKLYIGRNHNGKNNPNWKGGRRIKGERNKYAYLSGKWECPYAYANGEVREHIYVWWLNHKEEPIMLDELIHHVNGNTLDNRIENLKKMKRREHSVFHMNKLWVANGSMRKRKKRLLKHYKNKGDEIK